MDNIPSENDDNRHARRGKLFPTRDFFVSHPAYFLLAITAILTVPFFIPLGGVESDIPAVGDISTREVIAPFNFQIIKTDAELERERQVAKQNVPFVLDYVDGISISAKSEFEASWGAVSRLLENRAVTATAKIDSIKSRFTGISEESARTLAELRKPADVRTSVNELLDEVYTEGVFNWKTLSKGDTAQLFNVRKKSQETILPSERVPTLESALKKIEERASQKFISYPNKGRLVFELASVFLRPNLLPDKELTERNRLKAVEGVKRERGIVLKDQRVVDAHERVTEETHQKLVSLAVAKSGRYSSRPAVYSGLAVLARFLLALLLLWIFSKYIQIRFEESWRDMRRFAVLLLALWIPCLFAFIIRAAGWPEFLTPVAFSAALIAVLFGLEPAIAVVFASSAIVSLTSKNPQNLLITLLIEGTICALFFVRVQIRRESIIAIAYTSMAALISVFVLDFTSLTEYGTLGLRALTVLTASIFGPLLALGLLPLFERFSNIVTDFTLVDYANTNSQILQQLAIEAPGTFHHSIVVSNMAETAAEVVGADPLLTKAGALYHDIGKLTQPYYFSENLTEDNPHERLSPKVSFTVLSGHVQEGVRIAEKNNIPKPIINIIHEHHGDGVMRFFFEKARETDETVSEEEFSYKGPKPRSKEAAIVMLADTIEATVRSLSDIDKKSLRRIVRDTIEEKFISGQLADCDLTTEHLMQITEAFVKILEGVLHRRPRLKLKNVSQNISEDDIY